MKNFVSDGKALTLTAPSAVAAGDVVIVGSLAVIAHEDAASGAPLVGLTCGVFSVPTASTPTEGATAYATSAGEIVTTASGNTKVGAFVSAKVDGKADVYFTGQVA